MANNLQLNKEAINHIKCENEPQKPVQGHYLHLHLAISYLRNDIE
jgi:hypothetical protein